MSIDPELSTHPKEKVAMDDAQQAGLEARLAKVREQISDIGYEIDAGKAVMALMVGGGVFFLLIGLLAAYDLLSGSAGIYQPLGIDREMLKWIAIAGIGLGVAALAQALMRRRLHDRARELELARLEEEYACLRARDDGSEPEGAGSIKGPGASLN